MNFPGFVTINGIVQSPSEYDIDANNNIVFNEAPPIGSYINIIFTNQFTNGPTLSLKGNGSVNVFNISHDNNEHIKFNKLVNDIVKHKDNPAVKDLLEQLHIVTELLR